MSDLRKYDPSYKPGSNPNQKYGRDVVDNGPKWGSHVGRQESGAFVFDEKMKKERPGDWSQMIYERTAWLHEAKPKEIGPWTQRKTNGSTKKAGW